MENWNQNILGDHHWCPRTQGLFKTWLEAHSSWLCCPNVAFSVCDSEAVYLAKIDQAHEQALLAYTLDLKQQVDNVNTEPLCSHKEYKEIIKEVNT